MLGFALLALFAPALWHRVDVANAPGRQKPYAAFAAEFLDSIQGLATLKASGQSKAWTDNPATDAREIFRPTMWVLGTTVPSRAITDSAIASGVAGAPGGGGFCVTVGDLELAAPGGNI